MPFRAAAIVVSEEERQELQQMAQSRSLPAGDVMRARLMLLLTEGVPYRKIQEVLDTTAATISRWKERFRAHGIAGLIEERHPGQQPSVRTPKLQARILAAIKNGPNDGSTHWSCRKLASCFGVSKDTVQRVLTQADVRPHRLERYMASDDPDFENKAADVIGLYLAPPQHAAVFCLDEKTAIQALDRVDPVLPLSPGRAERHGFEYRRHGTLSLYAALNTQSGDIIGQTAARHTTDDFLTFLREVVATQPADRALHFILDNLATHKTQQVRTFLAEHPHVHFHFTPTYSSWLNQIELWFAKIEAHILARGIFTSVADLRRKIMKYIRHYNKTAKPVRWTYADPRRRIA